MKMDQGDDLVEYEDVMAQGRCHILRVADVWDDSYRSGSACSCQDGGNVSF